ncbi:MAG: DUF2017 family protein [Verrucomicrobiota bacterium]
MKIQTTLEGGLRVDIEDVQDWQLLDWIVADAEPAADDLADQLGNEITAQEIAADWREFVTPELRNVFFSDVEFVSHALAEARTRSDGESGSLWIAPADGMRWYSALNQARLALEAEHHFSNDDTLPDDADPQAWMRSQFYLALQSVILEEILTK